MTEEDKLISRVVVKCGIRRDKDEQMAKREQRTEERGEVKDKGGREISRELYKVTKGN